VWASDGTSVFRISPKTDLVTGERVAEQLVALAGLLDFAELVPVSAVDGFQLGLLADLLVARLPEGPPLYPEGELTDSPEATLVAELVREQLLSLVREELPHSIACRVTEWDWPRVRVEILVERDSQLLVIGPVRLELRPVAGSQRQPISVENRPFRQFTRHLYYAGVVLIPAHPVRLHHETRPNQDRIGLYHLNPRETRQHCDTD